jgi:hypothetical protein
VAIALAPTFPFNSGRGHRLSVSIDENPLQTININEASRYVINGYHDQNYEWETKRINRQVIKTDNFSIGKHRITIAPLDPGIVIERISIE